LSHFTSLFLCWVLLRLGLKNYWPDLALNVIPLISASWVARIIVVSHKSLPSYGVLKQMGPVSMSTLPLLRLPLPCRCPWGRSKAQCIMSRTVKYKEDGYLSTSLYQHRPPKPETSYPFLHRIASVWLIWSRLSSRIINTPGQTVDSIFWLYSILKKNAV
jgi:hypothetical protein